MLVRDVELDQGIGDLVFDPSAMDVAEVRRLFEFLEFNTLFDRLAEAIDTDLGPSAAEAEVLEAEVDVVADAPAAAKVRGAAGRRHDTARASRAAWAGVEGRSDLEGLALVRGPPRPTWCGSRVPCSATPPCATPSPRRPAPTAGPSPPTRPSRSSAPSTGLDVDVRSLALDTALAAYLLDPAESRYLLEELVVRYAGRGSRRRRGGRGSARPERLRHAVVHQHRPPGARGRPPRRPAPRARSTPKGCAPSTTTSRCRSLACSRAWRTPACAVDRRRAAAASGPAGGRRRRHHAAIVDAAGHEFNVNSTLQLREVLFDELRARAAEEDEDRLLHGRSEPGEARRSAPDHRAPPRVPRGGEAASTYGDGLLQEVGHDGRIHATFNQTVAGKGSSSDQPTSTTSPSARSSAESSGRRSSRRGGASRWWRTTTRSSSVASCTSWRIRA